jgi:hypothetical protein
MPPSTFNQLEGNRTADYDTMLQAREMFLAQTRGSDADSSAGTGPMLLVAGAAVLALILIVMAIAVG